MEELAEDAALGGLLRDALAPGRVRVSSLLGETLEGGHEAGALRGLLACGTVNGLLCRDGHGGGSRTGCLLVGSPGCSGIVLP